MDESFPRPVYRGLIAPAINAVLYCPAEAYEKARSWPRQSMLTTADKAQLAADHRLHATDTGSSDIQVALLTERIRQLTGHLRVHRKDHHSQRGLMKLVGQRRRLLRYLGRVEPARYKALIARLGLRK